MKRSEAAAELEKRGVHVPDDWPAKRVHDLLKDMRSRPESDDPPPPPPSYQPASPRG